jgi:hypothetical protein
MFARVSATISTERRVGVGAVWVLFVVPPTDRPLLQSEWPALLLFEFVADDLAGSVVALLLSIEVTVRRRSHQIRGASLGRTQAPLKPNNSFDQDCATGTS